jgi:hypothetical protein
MALPAQVVWEVRTTGSDTNGGGFVLAGAGTDFSQQDAQQVNIDNSAITTSINGTTVTFTGYTPTSADVDNIVQFLTGTNVIVHDPNNASPKCGFYRITGQTSTTWTLDRTPLTSGTTTNATAKMGGGLATPGQAASAASAGGAASPTIYVKKGTYSLAALGSNAVSIAGSAILISVVGSSDNKPSQLIGYDTNRTLTNSDAPPTLQPSAAYAYDIVKFSNTYSRIRNFKFRNPSNYGISSHAFLYQNATMSTAERLDIDCGTGASNYGIYQGNSFNHCIDCAVINATLAGFTGGNGTCSFADCYSSCPGGGYSGAAAFERCIAYNCTGGSTDGFNTTSAGGARYTNCVSHGSGRHGFMLYYDGQLTNCVATSNTGWGYALVVANNGVNATLYNCAGWNNTSGNVIGGIAAYSQYGFITLTGNPFTNVAGGDFSTNAVAGQGAALKGQGYPQSFYTLSTNNYPDVGAAQGNSGATVYLPFVTTRTRTLIRVIPKRLPALIIATPAPIVPLARQRMWSRTFFEKRRPPGLIPGAAVSLFIPLASTPRIMRQRQMYPKRVPAQILPALAAPPVVVSRQPRVIVRNVARPIGRKPSFIGAASSGTVVLEEGLNVFRFDPGVTSKSVYFKIRDSVTGQAKKSLTTASAGANAGYFRSQGASVNIPLVQLSTATDAWQVGGFIEVDPANSQGEYRLDMPNAAFASGADFALATLAFTNCFDSTVLIRLEKSTNNVGAGAITWTVQTNNSSTGLPLAGAIVWITTDLAGTNTIAGSLTTNAQGQAVFQLNAGTFYVWISDPGYTETNPTTIVVS